MDVEDRGVRQLQQPFGLGQAAGRQQAVGRVLGDRQHQVVDLVQPLAAALQPLALQQHAVAAGNSGLDPAHPRPQQHPHARAFQRGARRLVVQRAQGYPGEADVRGPRIGEQPGLEDHRRQRQRGLVGGGVQGGHADQVPERLDRPRRLPVPAQPVAEGLPVQRRVVQVQAAQGERGPPGGQSLPGVQVRVGGQAAAEVQRHRQRIAPQGAEPAGGDVADRDVQPGLDLHLVGDAEALQQPAVGGAAAQEDVLAVVDPQLAASERGGETAQPGPGLDQGHLDARVGQSQRSRDPGQPPADHDRP